MKKIQNGDVLNLVKTGENLRRIRKSHMETQTGLAEKLDCSQSYIAKIENGQISMPLSMAISICGLYGLYLEQLIIVNDDPFPKITVKFHKKAK